MNRIQKSALIVLAAVILALSGCSSSNGSAGASSDTSQQSQTDTSVVSSASTPPVETPSSTAPAVASLPPGPTTYHATQTTSDGYKQTMTLTLYPAIPGRDLPVLNKAWAGVGGTGEVPCQDAAGLDMYTGISIPTQTSVYAVGTLTIVNQTADFGSGDMRWDFAGGDNNGYAMGFGYSNGPECDSLSSGTLTSPHWTSPTWGPVPIVVAYGNVVNPNHPDGDYAKIAAEPFSLPLGGNPITVDGTTVDGIKVVAADSSWLQQARTQQ